MSMVNNALLRFDEHRCERSLSDFKQIFVKFRSNFWTSFSKMVAFNVSCNRDIFLCLLWLVFFRLSAAANDYGTNAVYGAVLNITYWDPTAGEWRSKKQEHGMYAMDGRLEPEWGRVVHVRTADNRTDGCGHPVNVPRYVDRWIALVEKGNCGIQQKISNAATEKNISAVVVYGHDVETEPLIFKRKGILFKYSWLFRKDVTRGPPEVPVAQMLLDKSTEGYKFVI